MKLPQFLHRALGLNEGPTDNLASRAKAYNSPAGLDLTQDPTRTFQRLRGYRNNYKVGGYLATGIDLYPLYTFGEWYTLESKNETKKKEIEDFLNRINFNAVTTALMVDALVVRDGVAEIVYGRGSLEKVPVNVVPRPAECFDFDTDLKGVIQSYTQKCDNRGNSIQKITLLPAQILHYQFSLDPTSPYGISLWERAVHDIKRDTRVAEAVTAGICLHGTPKFVTTVNSDRPDAPKVSAVEWGILEDSQKDFNAKDNFLYEGNVKMAVIDTGGVPNVGQYSEVTMARACAAVGAPAELLGLRQGTSDATAVSRIAAFYKQVKLVQKDIERLWNVEIIDKITGEPGLVKIKMNSASMDDFLKKAAALPMLRTGSDPDAVADAAWCREWLNIPEDKRTDEEKPKKQEFPGSLQEWAMKPPVDNPMMPTGKSEQEQAAMNELAAAAHALSEAVREG